jgi:ParB-like chromosome segregation protein Spo0J
MNIVILPELQACIDPLTEPERETLERSLLAEGCRDALVLWGEVLVDGHNRYEICRRLGLSFQTVQLGHLDSLEAAQLWMIDQQLGRRSLTNFQRGLLALRRNELEAARAGGVGGPAAASGEGGQAPWDGEAQLGAALAGAAAAATENIPLGRPGAQRSSSGSGSNREAIAKAARLSGSQVGLIEKIQKQAAPEVLAAVRAGELSINAAAALASLPAQEQAAAAAAGPDELKQAAKRVRDARRKPRDGGGGGAGNAGGSLTSDGAAPDGLEPLRQRVAELSAENVALRVQLMALQTELDAARKALAQQQS